jgi:hypothetical protein
MVQRCARRHEKTIRCAIEHGFDVLQNLNVTIADYNRSSLAHVLNMLLYKSAEFSACVIALAQASEELLKGRLEGCAVFWA